MSPISCTTSPGEPVDHSADLEAYCTGCNTLQVNAAPVGNPGRTAGIVLVVDGFAMPTDDIWLCVGCATALRDMLNAALESGAMYGPIADE